MKKISSVTLINKHYNLDCTQIFFLLFECTKRSWFIFDFVMSMIKYGISRISTQAREGKSLRQHNSNDIEAIVC